MTIPDKPSYSHGSTGTEPATPLDYENGDPFDSEHLDYYVNTPLTKIAAIIEFLNELDNDEDGVVDAADTADSATTAAQVKGNDIDSDGDGVVDSADTADETVSFQTGTSYPSNPEAGEVVFRTDRT